MTQTPTQPAPTKAATADAAHDAVLRIPLPLLAACGCGSGCGCGCQSGGTCQCGGGCCH
ncbi:hypothetical protein GXW83_31725 [Streptacidiphilus sp. PB12-B1b]|uniref:hypothetical protein n=1 Tax=Streptacidiphilus sp. PB12-B1b TaxID=2705012 RepID=UPI0015FDB541|nr:hypothetical protein [Streptacidiphilus sp. PB12-B1b]QMU74415.1 hypothetical protein GXW83_31725 [Streptacidiphilus sp. PB12-B1b]